MFICFFVALFLVATQASTRPLPVTRATTVENTPQTMIDEITSLDKQIGQHRANAGTTSAEKGSSSESISERDKILFLFYEYNTLRAEILGRQNHGFQLTALGATLCIYFFSRSWTKSTAQKATTQRANVPWPYKARLQPYRWHFDWHWLFVIAAIGTLCMGSWFTLRDTNKAAARLRQLEREINARSGEELLEWETKWGGAVTGFVGPAEPLSAQGSERSAWSER